MNLTQRQDGDIRGSVRHEERVLPGLGDDAVLAVHALHRPDHRVIAMEMVGERQVRVVEPLHLLRGEKYAHSLKSRPGPEDDKATGVRVHLTKTDVTVTSPVLGKFQQCVDTFKCVDYT